MVRRCGACAWRAGTRTGWPARSLARLHAGRRRLLRRSPVGCDLPEDGGRDAAALRLPQGLVLSSGRSRSCDSGNLFSRAATLGSALCWRVRSVSGLCHMLVAACSSLDSGACAAEYAQTMSNRETGQ